MVALFYDSIVAHLEDPHVSLIALLQTLEIAIRIISTVISRELAILSTMICHAIWLSVMKIAELMQLLVEM